MNKYMISARPAVVANARPTVVAVAITTALLFSPLAVNAISLDSPTNNLAESRLSERSPTTQLAHRYHGNRRGGGMKKILEQLNLTPEQSQKIDAIHEQFHSDKESLFEEMRTNHQEMRSLFASDASSQELRKQHQKIQDLHQQLGNNRFETMLQVREILTPEQRSQLAELMKQHRGKRGNPNFN